MNAELGRAEYGILQITHTHTRLDTHRRASQTKNHSTRAILSLLSTGTPHKTPNSLLCFHNSNNTTNSNYISNTITTTNNNSNNNNGLP